MLSTPDNCRPTVATDQSYFLGVLGLKTKPYTSSSLCYIWAMSLLNRNPIKEKKKEENNMQDLNTQCIPTFLPTFLLNCTSVTSQRNTQGYKSQFCWTVSSQDFYRLLFVINLPVALILPFPSPFLLSFIKLTSSGVYLHLSGKACLTC